MDNLVVDIENIEMRQSIHCSSCSLYKVLVKECRMLIPLSKVKMKLKIIRKNINLKEHMSTIIIHNSIQEQKVLQYCFCNWYDVNV